MLHVFFLLNPQRAVDDKFRTVAEKEEEARRLQLLLREKERDLERQRCVLSNNEETITVRIHTGHTPSHSAATTSHCWPSVCVCVCVRAWGCWCVVRLCSWSRCATPGGTSSGNSWRAKRD